MHFTPNVLQMKGEDYSYPSLSSILKIKLAKNVSSLLQTFTESHHRWKQTSATSTGNHFSYFQLDSGGQPIGHW